MVWLTSSQAKGQSNTQLLLTNNLPVLPDYDTEKDWILDGSRYVAGVYKDQKENEIILSNGLIQRVFTTKPNGATVAFDNLITGESLIRGVKPEAIVKINNIEYTVGGLIGQPNFAFLKPEWLAEMSKDSTSMTLTQFRIEEPKASMKWKRVRHHQSDLAWPPKGVHLQMLYNLPESHSSEDKFSVTVHYEMYDEIPVISKWITVENVGDRAMIIDHFTSEILAAVEYGSSVESRNYNVPKPNIHVETDYAFSSFDVNDANHHAVHWLPDPEYATQVNYLRQTPCLLRVEPELGPARSLDPGKTFTSFRTYLLPYDSYDRERQGLSIKKMYRHIAPWITENPLMMHARFADWESVKKAIDQASEVGFEMVILTFGSGFNIEDNSEEYVSKMKAYAEYARSKNVEIGGYSLLASRSINAENDVVMPDDELPTFGNSPCLESEWGEEYFSKLYHFYEKSGFTLLEHDGSYPGDVCAANHHPGHSGLQDSRWNQYEKIATFYHWCRAQGIYLNIPDYYYLSGGSKCGMGYREVNWSLPREQQLIHTRQNIYDGSWQKTPSMGWMFVPLTEYHGGGEAATIEPLQNHLTHYNNIMMSNLGAGVQACYRGPRLYDSEETKQMVKENIDWFKKHREVLEGDIIHLKRADGKSLDYWLNVNPGGDEKGLLMIYNPLDHPIQQKIKVPLYYTGLDHTAEVTDAESNTMKKQLKRDYSIDLKVEVKANDYTWYIFK
ncbi:alpha-galactosidase [Portibacter marinus]|uniref:alpha-galactosidase n=1 Tax=Portibacter marinus TaxID=2898660 RepID=UPI001F1F9901|nr:alpha-galactosidase [Portibacter marinus]